jgi:hypothetical protein
MEREENWAGCEFESIEFGDKRLNDRLVKVAEALSKNPQAPINQANKDWASTKAAYRLFSNEKVKAETILSSHRKSTIERLDEHEIVLAIQDTTYFNFSEHHACEGLGYIGTEKLKGVVAHNTLLCSDEGLAIGLFEQKLYTRTEIKPEEKESIRWLESVRSVNANVKEHQKQKIVFVCDREGDFTDLLHEIQNSGMGFVIRASHHRKIVSEEFKTSFEAIEQSPVAGSVTVTIPPREGKKGYEVVADVRYTSLTITSKERVFPSLPLYMVYISGSSASGEKLAWYLITNVPVTNLESAIERIQWYKLRWQIEIFHKILKSGCRAEECRVEEINRLYKCLTLYSIIAWRLLRIVYIGRCSPDLPASLILSNAELRALQVLFTKKGKSVKINTIEQAIVYIAQLGGYLARKKDLPPGSTVIWRGWQQLQTAVNFLLAYEDITYG